MRFHTANGPAPAIPVQEGAPWPIFRRDGRNSGFLPLQPVIRPAAASNTPAASVPSQIRALPVQPAAAAAPAAGGLSEAVRPWTFQTGKGIFSTPVVGKDETIYFGSADRRFYALSSAGELLWTFSTGEIIDSAACIGAYDKEHRSFPLTVLSGDGCMYRLRSECVEAVGCSGNRQPKTGTRERQPPGSTAAQEPQSRALRRQSEAGAYGDRQPEDHGRLPPKAGGQLHPDRSSRETDNGAQHKDERIIWTFRARDESGKSFNNWWEGNAVIGPGGGIYAGNTNFSYYAVSPEGRLKWRCRTGSNCWSAAAFASDRIFWGSNDTCVRAVGYDGRELWRRRTKGIIAASAALGADGTVYIGSFDGYLYALDPRNGKVRWKFAAEDHIYSSAALLPAAGGTGETICFGSADGRLYALDSRGGLKWSYDTGAPIRSSPAAGRSPDGTGTIIYFGCGNGKLYALDGETGRRRWSFDTTPEDSLSAIRNDLNGSPALGRNGIYIGGEHGKLVFVPYDYPLRAPDDPRCCISPDEELPADCLRLVPVDAGGSFLKEAASSRGPFSPEDLSATASYPADDVISFRLTARRNGKSLPYRLPNRLLRRKERSIRLRTDPALPFRLRTAGNGLYLHCIPEERLPYGLRFKLSIEAGCVSGGLRFGNLKLGGRKRAVITESYRFETPPPPAVPRQPETAADVTGVYEWRRLAVPFPTMLPSLNQIGFDTYHWLLGTIAVREERPGRGRLLFWICGAQPDEEKRLSVSPDRSYLFPVSGSYSEGSFCAACSNFSMSITGIPVPFNRMEMRAALPARDAAPVGGSIIAESRIWKIPNFGVKMVAAGLAGTGMRTLFSRGSFLLQHAQLQPPAGVGISRIWKDGRRIHASLLRPSGTYVPAARHFVSIVLYRRDSLEALSLDYRRITENKTDGGGICEAVLTLPEKLRIAGGIDCTALIDVFPVARAKWEEL